MVGGYGSKDAWNTRIIENAHSTTEKFVRRQTKLQIGYIVNMCLYFSSPTLLFSAEINHDSPLRTSLEMDSIDSFMTSLSLFYSPSSQYLHFNTRTSEGNA